MKAFLSLTKNGVQLAAEFVPEWVTVGYCNTQADVVLHAAVAVGYGQEQLPVMRAVAEATCVQRRTPVISIYGDTVQVIFVTSPVPPVLLDNLKRSPALSTVVADLARLSVVSMADVCQDDKEFEIFKRCYARDRYILLLLMEVAQVGLEGGRGIPFKIFTVKDLKSEFQRIF